MQTGHACTTTVSMFGEVRERAIRAFGVSSGAALPSPDFLNQTSRNAIHDGPVDHRMNFVGRAKIAIGVVCDHCHFRFLCEKTVNTLRRN